mgnify:CR=1 FL=1
MGLDPPCTLNPTATQSTRICGTWQALRGRHNALTAMQRRVFDGNRPPLCCGAASSKPAACVSWNEACGLHVERARPSHHICRCPPARLPARPCHAASRQRAAERVQTHQPAAGTAANTVRPNRVSARRRPRALRHNYARQPDHWVRYHPSLRMRRLSRSRLQAQWGGVLASVVGGDVGCVCVCECVCVCVRACVRARARARVCACARVCTYNNCPECSTQQQCPPVHPHTLTPPKPPPHPHTPPPPRAPHLGSHLSSSCVHRGS